MKKTIKIERSGKTDFSFAFDGVIKSITIEELDTTGKASNISNTVIDVLLNSVRIIEDYQGSRLDKLPIVGGEYKVNESTRGQVIIENIGLVPVVKPVLINFDYEPLEGKTLDFTGA